MNTQSNVIRQEAGDIIVGEEGGKPLITFHQNGTISFAKRLRPDTAAQMFLDSLAREFVRRSEKAVEPPPALETELRLVDTGEGVQPDPQLPAGDDPTDFPMDVVPEELQLVQISADRSEEITLETPLPEVEPVQFDAAEHEERVAEAAQAEGEAIEDQRSAQDASLL